MTKASKPQIAKIHVLINNLGLTNDDKKEIIYNLTGGRTQSSRELILDEAKRLIQHLCQSDPKERLKSSITSLAYKAGIIYGNTPEDKKINMAKLNLFLRERGAVKKDFNFLSYDELIKVNRQFEAMNKNVAKAKDKKSADKALNALLNELEIATV